MPSIIFVVVGFVKGGVVISNKQSVLDNKVVHGEARLLVQALTQCPFSFLPKARTITTDWVAR